MLWFHNEMTERKRDFLREADKLSIEIVLRRGDAPAKERLAASTERYLALDEMPTWPIDEQTRKRFRLNNLALLMPLAGQAIGSSELGEQDANIGRILALAGTFSGCSNEPGRG